MKNVWFRTPPVVASLLILTACATYVPPQPAPPESFSRDLKAPYDKTWSVVTNVAGANFFKIKAFEKASGLLTLDFDLKEVVPYVDCGAAVSKSSQEARPVLYALGLSGMYVTGTANITIKADGSNRTEVQFNSQYDLVALRNNANGIMFTAAEWHFTSGSSDTQSIGGVMITCRPSYKIERSFLNEVAARV